MSHSLMRRQPVRRFLYGCSTLASSKVPQCRISPSRITSISYLAASPPCKGAGEHDEKMEGLRGLLRELASQRSEGAMASNKQPHTATNTEGSLVDSVIQDSVTQDLLNCTSTEPNFHIQSNHRWLPDSAFRFTFDFPRELSDLEMEKLKGKVGLQQVMEDPELEDAFSHTSSDQTPDPPSTCWSRQSLATPRKTIPFSHHVYFPEAPIIWDHTELRGVPHNEMAALDSDPKILYGRNIDWCTVQHSTAVAASLIGSSCGVVEPSEGGLEFVSIPFKTNTAKFSELEKATATILDDMESRSLTPSSCTVLLTQQFERKVLATEGSIIQELAKRGCNFVFAAGNYGVPVHLTGAAVPGEHFTKAVLVVGAHDEKNEECDFSNFGKEQPVHGTSIAAPKCLGWALRKGPPASVFGKIQTGAELLPVKVRSRTQADFVRFFGKRPDNLHELQKEYLRMLEKDEAILKQVTSRELLAQANTSLPNRAQFEADVSWETGMELTTGMTRRQLAIVSLR